MDSDRTSNWQLPLSVEKPPIYSFQQPKLFIHLNLITSLEPNIIVRIADSGDTIYAKNITDEMASSAQARGTGIAKRSPEYVSQKIQEGKAVIAVTATGEWVGFCYIEAWQHGQFVANSGLIVAPSFRKTGIAKKIKHTIFQLSRDKFPNSKLFGLTTGLAVMKINSELGYEPVTYSELTDDEEFWAGCKSCVNYDILMSKDRKNCMCTAMLYEPKQDINQQEVVGEISNKNEGANLFMKINNNKFIS